MELSEFINKLNGIEGREYLIDFCRKNILHGTPFIFSQKEDEYYEFRKRIAHRFDVSFYEVYIMGSAKLGFSPHKRKPFDLESDVDVAIVSEKLFSQIMDVVMDYQMKLRMSRETVTERELRMYHDFLEYTALGWIRPDKLPISFQVKAFKDNWFEFFRSISYGNSEIGNYKVAAGIFKTYSHLEIYIINSIEQVRAALRVEVENG